MMFEGRVIIHKRGCTIPIYFPCQNYLVMYTCTYAKNTVIPHWFKDEFYFIFYFKLDISYINCLHKLLNEGY